MFTNNFIAKKLFIINHHEKFCVAYLQHFFLFFETMDKFLKFWHSTGMSYMISKIYTIYWQIYFNWILDFQYVAIVLFQTVIPTIQEIKSRKSHCPIIHFYRCFSVRLETHLYTTLTYGESFPNNTKPIVWGQNEGHCQYFQHKWRLRKEKFMIFEKNCTWKMMKFCYNHKFASYWFQTHQI